MILRLMTWQRMLLSDLFDVERYFRPLEDSEQFGLCPLSTSAAHLLSLLVNDRSSSATLPSSSLQVLPLAMRQARHLGRGALLG